MTRMFLDRLHEHSRTQPNKVAIELLAAGEARVLRYGELEAGVQRTMAWLRALGLGPGDCAATQLPTCLAFVQLHLAICRLGAVHLPLNPAFPAAELRYFLGDSGARLFFHAADIESATSIAGNLPDLRCIALRDDADFAQHVAVHEPLSPPLPADPTRWR